MQSSSSLASVSLRQGVQTAVGDRVARTDGLGQTKLTANYRLNAKQDRLSAGGTGRCVRTRSSWQSNRSYTGSFILLPSSIFAWLEAGTKSILLKTMQCLYTQL